MRSLLRFLCSSKRIAAASTASGCKTYWPFCNMAPTGGLPRGRFIAIFYVQLYLCECDLNAPIPMDHSPGYDQNNHCRNHKDSPSMLQKHLPVYRIALF